MKDFFRTFLIRNFFKSNKHPEMAIIPNDHQGKEILSLGVYEKPFIKYLRKNKLLENKRVFVDIGASYGTFTINFSKHFDHVYSFEPSPISNALLNLNIELNKIKNAKAEKLGVSNKAETVFFNIPDNDLGSARIIVGENQNSDSIKIETISLDEYFLHNDHAKSIDVIKVDVEGLEHNVFLGAEKILKTSHPLLLFESHGERHITENIEILKTYGYKYFYKLTQSRRLSKRFILNLFNFLLRPNYVSVEEIKDYKETNYQMVIASSITIL